MVDYVEKQRPQPLTPEPELRVTHKRVMHQDAPHSMVDQGRPRATKGGLGRPRSTNANPGRRRELQAPLQNGTTPGSSRGTLPSLTGTSQ